MKAGLSHKLRILLLMSLPCLCSANAGIPVGSYAACWSILWLIPVIWAEGWVLKHDLKVRPGLAYATSMMGNLLSTLAGAVIAVFATVPILAEDGPGTDLLTLILYVPLFALSVLIEAPFACWRLKGIPKRAVFRSVLRGNLVSYAAMSIFIVARFCKHWYLLKYT